MISEAIYQLRELVCEPDGKKRLEALDDWEQRYVRDLHARVVIDQVMRNEESYAEYMKDAAFQKLGLELQKVAEERLYYETDSVEFTWSVTVIDGSRT